MIKVVYKRRLLQLLARDSSLSPIMKIKN